MKRRNGLEFCISFDTKEIPGRVVAVSVALGKTIMGPNDRVRVDLCDHPLYPALVKYVESNPPGGKPPRG